MSNRLHPAKLGLIGLVASLRGSDTVVTFEDEDVPSTLPPALSLCVFRIAQEGVQNALRYSGAEVVSMHVRGGANRLTLSVVDDGAGFDVEAVRGTGLGLIGMSERVETLGGTFEIRSQPGAGTRLEVTVPLHCL